MTRDRIDKAHKDYRKNVPNYINVIDSFRKAIEDNLPQPTGVDENTSDWYHTFKELYEHRIALFIALMKCNPKISWRANNHNDWTNWDWWFIAWMHLDSWDISYHLPTDKRKELDWLWITTTLNAPKRDWHTSNDVIERLYKWAPQPTGVDVIIKKLEWWLAINAFWDLLIDLWADEIMWIISDLKSIQQPTQAEEKCRFKSFAIWVVKDKESFEDMFWDYENLQYPFVYCLWEDTQENRDAQVKSL